MKLWKLASTAIALVLTTSVNAATINFNTTPTDTSYINNGLLLSSNTGGYQIGSCGVDAVGCLANTTSDIDVSYSGTLTFIFVNLGTTDQSSTDFIEFIMCRGCDARSSSAYVYDFDGILLSSINLNTPLGVENRTFSYSAVNIGSMVIDLDVDGVESLTFGAISTVPVPAAVWLFNWVGWFC